MNRPTIAVCVPSHDRWHAEFGVCLVDAMCTYTRSGGLVGLISAQGTMLPDQRNSLVQEAKTATASHILWIDCDQTFPAGTIAQLVGHGLPVVGANIARRVPPFTPCAVANGKPVYTVPGSTGTEEVDSLGLGLTLVETALFTGPPRWFEFGWDAASNGPLGEDVGFFRALAQRGIKPVIDHGLSQRVGHLGTLKVTANIAWKARKHGAR